MTLCGSVGGFLSGVASDSEANCSAWGITSSGDAEVPCLFAVLLEGGVEDDDCEGVAECVPDRFEMGECCRLPCLRLGVTGA